MEEIKKIEIYHFQDVLGKYHEVYKVKDVQKVIKNMLVTIKKLDKEVQLGKIGKYKEILDMVQKLIKMRKDEVMNLKLKDQIIVYKRVK